MAFKKGQVANPRGCPKGAHHKGRPSNEFRELCKQAFDDVQSLGLVKSIIAGVNFPTSFGPMPAKPETRLEAVKTLKEWGYGKEKIEMEHTGEVGSRVYFVHPEGEK